MAVSQSLTSIMEEMVTKVMEDAVSTSIIFTQVPVKEVHMVKEYARRNVVDVTIFSFFSCDRSPTRVTRKVTKSSLPVVQQVFPTSSTLTTLSPWSPLPQLVNPEGDSSTCHQQDRRK